MARRQRKHNNPSRYFRQFIITIIGKLYAANSATGLMGGAIGGRLAVDYEVPAVDFDDMVYAISLVSDDPRVAVEAIVEFGEISEPTMQDNVAQQIADDLIERMSTLLATYGYIEPLKQLPIITSQTAHNGLRHRIILK